MPRNFSFDSQGFFFLIKLCVLVLALAGFAHLSGTAVGRHVYGAPATVPASHSSPLMARAMERLRGALEANATQAVADVGQAPRTVDEYVPESGGFIGIDLPAMKLTVYEDGEEVATYEVLAHSDPSGPDRVPAGLFTVEAKEELGYSEVDKRYMPFRLRFNERYSVYGTADMDEEEASAPSPLAGVRLHASDAAELYAETEVGDQVYVLAPVPDIAATVGAVSVRHDTAPAVSARAFAVRDAVTGDMYLTKNAELRYPVASITKLTTALVASEVIGLNEEVDVRGRAYIVGELYYPLFLASDNGVAESLAAHHGTAKFIARMNTKARALGMYNTSFADASGLSPRNVSTAEDLTVLGRYLYHSKRGLLDISGDDSMTITASDGTEWPVQNQNKLARDPHFVGGKLGFTDEARQTSVGLFTVVVDGRTRVVCVVVLGSDDWKQDTRTLLTWFRENARGESPEHSRAR